MLPLAYWIFTFIGILASIVQVILTFYLLYKYILKSDTWKKLEYQLILFRVFLDALIGAVGLVYFLSTIQMLTSPETGSYDVSFVISIICSHFLEMRSFLAAVIAIERVLAVMIPTDFHKYRRKVPNWPIFVFIFSTGAASYTVLLGICDFRFPLDPRCTNFMCAVSHCYHTYVFTTKMIYTSTNIFFSVILCYKLSWLHWKHNNFPVDIRRLNWLSLTDGLTTLIFDLLPSLVINSHLVNVQELGPVFGAFRHSARAVEAAVMVKLMKKKLVVKKRTSIVNVSIKVN